MEELKMSKEQNLITYYLICNKLKNVIRTGWKDWNVQRERIESVAEHVYGVQLLAKLLIQVTKQFLYSYYITKI